MQTSLARVLARSRFVRQVQSRGLLFLALSGSACADDNSDVPATDPTEADGLSVLEAALDAIVAQGAPGVVALSRAGSDVVLRARGVRDIDTGEPLRATDRFRVGSNSKPFMATVVLQLVGEGRLGLDDSVERWLPGALPRGTEITVRQLLNHTSGIAHNAHDPELLAPYLKGELEHNWSPAELVAFSADEPLAFEPGTGHLYSNTNYHVLGLIVRAVTQRDPLAEVERRIISPLALVATDWPASDPEIAGHHSRGYHFSPDFGGKLDMTVFSPSWAWTAGGLISSADDLARFNVALFTGELLSPELMRELLTSVETDEGGYALGVQTWETPCGPAWGHEGDFPGYHSIVMTSLDGERQAVVLINSDDAIGIGLADPHLAPAAFAAYCRA
jgi:D-alanyl-D-alanine carboxypeptidase